MASQRFGLQDLLLALLKCVLGIAIALFVIGLAGAATARFFLTQLSTLPERPVYDNDTPAAQPASTESASESQATAVADVPVVEQASEERTAGAIAPAADVLFQAAVTYGEGLLVRAGAGADYETIDGVGYDAVVDVLEESGQWYRIRTATGVEGWIKGQNNTQPL